MKKTSSIIFIIFTFFFLSLIEVQACWCRKDPEETNTPKNFRKTINRTYKQSVVIFSATATERTGEFLRFKVKQLWKGEEKDEILFTSIHYVNWSKIGDGRDYFVDDCIFNDFKIGESYLIYAVIKNGKFEVSRCGRTQILSDATKDIEELNLIIEKSKSKK